MPPSARPAPSDPTPPPEAVTPLLRALAVLRALTAAGGRAAVSDLVRATGLPRATADRVLSTLAALGHVRAEGREAVLAPGLLELGNAYLAATGLPDRLGPLADRLADVLDESVSLAVPDGDGVRFVHQATRRRAMSLAFRIGDLLPAERGAPGALFAADWGPAEWRRWRARRAADPADAGFPAVPARSAGEAAPAGARRLAADFAARVAAARAAGWAPDDQLIEPGLIAVAVPVRDPAGGPACAVSVVSHTSRHTAAGLPEAVLPRLRETVAAMEAALAAPSAASAAAEPEAGHRAAARRAAKRQLGPGFVESVARGLAVLTAFGAGRSALTLSAVAEATGLPRATARRALITLEHLGYTAATGGRHRLTPQVLELGFAQLSGLTLPDLARPHLAALAERVGESASLAVPADEADGVGRAVRYVRYIAAVPAARIMSVTVSPGGRAPAQATAPGRVLLAALPPAAGPAGPPALLDRVRADGHALVDDELEPGVRSVAVPVRDRAGRAVAAVTVSAHAAGRAPAAARAAVLPALRETAAAVEAELRVAGRYLPVPVP
ncbi:MULTISPECIES: IclR family transcriptional regulator C-terminal domain-containing protein [unclassified Streptomyces]|uniref:IclR family transcriptional regulator domain-containing protein n=1 Tax=unclassified Streptomyces TaxID=2593676 RepID=UPI00039DB3D4|nr:MULTISPECIES: IclR family transcriptional regulator C-terminal domain-containing protein [unclassified Streptomyces]MYT28034.1 helix-turn-helix domain-containing protein [Streptomyces sp. SID8354]